MAFALKNSSNHNQVAQIDAHGNIQSLSQN